MKIIEQGFINVIICSTVCDNAVKIVTYEQYVTKNIRLQIKTEKWKLTKYNSTINLVLNEKRPESG